MFVCNDPEHGMQHCCMYNYDQLRRVIIRIFMYVHTYECELMCCVEGNQRNYSLNLLRSGWIVFRCKEMTCSLYPVYSARTESTIFRWAEMVRFGNIITPSHSIPSDPSRQHLYSINGITYGLHNLNNMLITQIEIDPNFHIIYKSGHYLAQNSRSVGVCVYQHTHTHTHSCAYVVCMCLPW